VARLDKVHEGTSHIFNDKFFESLSIVTNALDNVKARLYVDSRCVTARRPLLESGTLGSMGHTQIILPGVTESYASMADEEGNQEIPICTLKMFPEESIHCVEWARDHFGKMFTINPRSTMALLEAGEAINPTSQQDITNLKNGLKMLQKRPKNFNDCIEYARKRFEKYYSKDIKQLLHVYPLDTKTKEGNMFWSLPKRAPTALVFNKDDKLHCMFIASLACLRATIYFLPIPENSRTDEFRTHCGEMANAVKVAEFKPNEAKAKEMQAEINKADKGKEE